MTALMWRTRRLKLPLLFLVAMLLPAIALSWFGWQLLDQDRKLERQRVQDTVEAAADRATGAIERELGAIERALGAGRHDAAPPGVPGATVIRLSPTGAVTTLMGAPLLHAPTVSRRTENEAKVWAEAERQEFVARNNASALTAYRLLTRHADRNISAAAFIRLARVLRKMGRVDDALLAYRSAAQVRGATVMGDPADLIGRWARVDLLASLKRHEDASAEAVLLDRDLRTGRWPLDETTAATYLEALQPWRSDRDREILRDQLRLAALVSAIWRDWRAQSPKPAPRELKRSDDVEFLIVRREVASDLAVFVGPADAVVRAWQHHWLLPGLTVALEPFDTGVTIPGVTSPNRTVRPATDTGLPWSVRVSASGVPPELAKASAVRTRTIVAVIVIAAGLMLGTGYLVVRAVNKELAVVRQQSRFVAAVSHEFRSPLTSLAHLTALLRSDFQPSEQRRREYYDLMASETDRLRQFVETLLDFGRMQAGAMRYRLQPIAVNEFVSRVINRFEHHAAALAHPLSLSMNDRALAISADEEALGRALWNLLENAAKYSSPDRPITVSTDEAEGQVLITVRDEGPGIPDAEQPFIFDQFYRGAAATESAIKGTGVGLAVVRHIVEGHHGKVRCSSCSGVGSAFTISLPVTGDDDVMRERKAS